MVIDEGAYFAEVLLGRKRITHPQRAFLHEHRCNRPPALIKPCLNNGSLGLLVGICPEIKHFSLQQHHFKQLVDIYILLCRHLNKKSVAAPLLGKQAVVTQFLAHFFGIGLGLVDLVDGHNNRNLGGAGMIYRLYGLGSGPLFGGNDKNDDIGNLRAAGAHGRECFVARGVDKSDFPARSGDLIGADMLGNTAFFPVGDAGIADGVKQACLAVIDMPHHGHDRTAKLELFLIIRRLLFIHGFFFDGNSLDLIIEISRHQGSRIGVQHLIDGRHDPQSYEFLDDLACLDSHAPGQLSDRNAGLHSDFTLDRFGDRLFRLLPGRRSGLAFSPDFERRLVFYLIAYAAVRRSPRFGLFACILAECFLLPAEFLAFGLLFDKLFGAPVALRRFFFDRWFFDKARLHRCGNKGLHRPFGLHGPFRLRRLLGLTDTPWLQINAADNAGRGAFLAFKLYFFNGRLLRFRLLRRLRCRLRLLFGRLGAPLGSLVRLCRLPHLCRSETLRHSFGSRRLLFGGSFFGLLCFGLFAPPDNRAADAPLYQRLA